MPPRTRPSLSAIGVAVILGSLAVAVGLWAASSATHFAATPDSRTFGVNPQWLGPTYGEGVDNFPAGATYVPPANAWVLAAEGVGEYVPPIARINASNPQDVRLGGSCSSFGEFYPGSGSTVYFDCANSTGESIAVYNASSGDVERVLPFSHDLVCDRSMTLDPRGNILYCPGYPLAILRGMNVTTGAIEVNVTIPGPLWGDSPVWFDPTGRSLWYGDTSNQTLYKLEPRTGAILASLTLPGSPEGIVPDPSAGVALVYYDSINPGSIAEVSIVNVSAFRVTDDLSLPVIARWGVLDPHSQVAYLSTLEGIAAIDVTNRQLIGSLTPIPCPRYGYQPPSLGPIALDPVSGQLMVAAQCQSGELTDFVDPWIASPALGVERFPTYSAIPWVGTAVPLLVGVVGVAFGGATLAAGAWQRALRSWESDYRRVTGLGPGPPEGERATEGVRER